MRLLEKMYVVYCLLSIVYCYIYVWSNVATFWNFRDLSCIRTSTCIYLVFYRCARDCCHRLSFFILLHYVNATLSFAIAAAHTLSLHFSLFFLVCVSW